MRLAATVMAVITALALAGEASASRFSRHVERAQAVAIVVWDAKPACGPVFTLRSLLPRDRIAMGSAQACAIWFGRNRWHRKFRDDWQSFCEVYIHEWGHVLGHGHSDDPFSTMHPDYWWRYTHPACVT